MYQFKVSRVTHFFEKDRSQRLQGRANCHQFISNSLISRLFAGKKTISSERTCGDLSFQISHATEPLFELGGNALAHGAVLADAVSQRKIFVVGLISNLEHIARFLFHRHFLLEIPSWNNKSASKSVAWAVPKKAYTEEGIEDCESLYGGEMKDGTALQ